MINALRADDEEALMVAVPAAKDLREYIMPCELFDAAQQRMDEFAVARGRARAKALLERLIETAEGPEDAQTMRAAYQKAEEAQLGGSLMRRAENKLHELTLLEDAALREAEASAWKAREPPKLSDCLAKPRVDSVMQQGRDGRSDTTASSQGRDGRSKTMASKATTEEIDLLSGQRLKHFLLSRDVDVPEAADDEELRGMARVCADSPLVLWVRNKASDGRVYFYNRKTKETSWTRPDEA